MIKTFKRLWRFSEKRHTNFIQALIFSFIRSMISVSAFLAVVVAIQVLLGSRNLHSGIWQIVTFMLICIAGNFIASYFEQINTLRTGFFMVGDKRVDQGNHLRSMPLGFFNHTTTGKICATLTSTLSGVENAAAMVMVGIVSGLFSAFGLLLFMMFYDWRIGLLVGIGMLAYLELVSYQMKLSEKNAPALQAAQSDLSEAAISFLRGIKVTKAFRFQHGDEGLKAAIQKSCDANLTLTRKSMPSQYAAGICIAVFESLILLCSLYLSLQGGRVDIVKALVVIIFSFVVYASLNQAGSMLSMIGLLDSGLAESEEIDNAPHLQQLQPQETAESNEIIFENVSFSYGQHEVLHGISTCITPNSLTAVIGPSGSGKTTLCQLIPRFRDVSAGRITIGGADIRHMSNGELMKKISMVFQNVYLFEDTVFNNIRFGNPTASIEQVRAAAKAAHCDAFIMNLPQGYDTVLQEGGCSLSGGEKQRISIARAILKDSPIIILDEATSALDAENENEILSAIDSLTANKTVIMIAHRIKSVQKADKIIALKDGRIVQEGTHSELRHVPGLYADFLASREKATQWKLGT